MTGGPRLREREPLQVAGGHDDGAEGLRALLDGRRRLLLHTTERDVADGRRLTARSHETRVVERAAGDGRPVVDDLVVRAGLDDQCGHRGDTRESATCGVAVDGDTVGVTLEDVATPGPVGLGDVEVPLGAILVVVASGGRRSSDAQRREKQCEHPH